MLKQKRQLLGIFLKAEIKNSTSFLQNKQKKASVSKNRKKKNKPKTIQPKGFCFFCLPFLLHWKISLENYLLLWETSTHLDICESASQKLKRANPQEQMREVNRSWCGQQSLTTVKYQAQLWGNSQRKQWCVFPGLFLLILHVNK